MRASLQARLLAFDSRREAVGVVSRTCPVCGASLADHRADARFCSPACRREHHRVSRLLSGQSDSGYRNLAEYDRRARRRAGGV